MKKEDQVVESIIHMIARDGYGIGDRLPAERALSKALCTSRHTLRGAIRQLAARGLLEVRSGSGCYVTAAPDAIKAWTRPEPGAGRDDQVELLEAYFHFMPKLGAIAAENAVVEEIEALETCLMRISKAVISLRWDLLGVEYRRFMDQIAQCAHNRFLEHAGRQLNGATRLLFDSFAQVPKEVQEALFADYVEMVKAIKGSDPVQAASRIRDHIVRLSRLLVQIHPLNLSGTLQRAVESEKD